MAVVCDTGAVYALYDADDQHHEECKAVVSAESGPLFLPLALISEIDYLLTSRLGCDAALDFLDSIQSGAFTLVGLMTEDLVRCRELVAQYRDLPLGLADASVVATAERLGLQTLFTVDQRHFRTIRPRGFGHFVILPADRASA
jgi:predicted nucleic acid-binding protein